MKIASKLGRIITLDAVITPEPQVQQMTKPVSVYLRKENASRPQRELSQHYSLVIMRLALNLDNSYEVLDTTCQQFT